MHYYSVFLILLTLCLGLTKAQNVSSIGRPCACTPSQAWLDIVLLLDVSSNMGTAIGDIASFASSVFSQFTVSQNLTQAVRVGIVTYAQSSTRVALLNAFINNDLLTFALLGIESTSSNQLNLKSGFETATQTFFLPGNRANARKVVIIIASDYSSASDDDATQVANEFKSNGGVIVTVAYNKSDKALSDLGQLATPGMALNNTDGALSLLQEFTQALCSANCFCKKVDRQFTAIINGSVTYFGECLSAVSIASVQDLAELNCRRRNSSLAIVLSDEKSQFVKTLNGDTFSQDRFWLAARHNGNNYNWIDKDGREIPLSFSDWNPGFPNLSRGNCVSMARAGGFRFGWQNAQCSDATNDFYDYFCQYDACDTDNYCTDAI